MNAPGRITLLLGLGCCALLTFAAGRCFGGRPCLPEEYVLRFLWLALPAVGLSLIVASVTSGAPEREKVKRVALIIVSLAVIAVVLLVVSWNLFPPLI